MQPTEIAIIRATDEVVALLGSAPPKSKEPGTPPGESTPKTLAPMMTIFEENASYGSKRKG